MGKKYIIELEEEPFIKHFKNGAWETIYRVKGFNSLVFDYNGLGKLTPYTEPDLEQVRKDVWEVARKIVAFSTVDRRKVFGSEFMYSILEKHTASEAIEKIRQYEQEKEEIKVGNEIKSGNERYVVLQKYLNNIDEPMVILFNRRNGEISMFHLYNGNGAIFEKTDKDFPEIAEVLQKMEEN